MLGNLWRKLSASFSRGSRPKGKPSRPDGFRPTVEALEDRTLPTGFSLTSSAFRNGQSIPAEFPKLFGNRSPQLAWHNPPPDTKSFALLMDDLNVPDAPGGTFNHWVLFNLPKDTLSLRAGIPSGLAHAALSNPDGALQGLNGNLEIGYLGPNPPPGEMHTYVFQVFALNERLNLHAGATRTQLAEAMLGRAVKVPFTEVPIAKGGHILAEATLRGTFPDLQSLIG
jgi:Raf kinase inhibitor-like YbhB/YbcL family protein